MKKNKMMRLASALLVLVLLTTCAISGTFAKYTSTANGEDTARVAYWGWGSSDFQIDDLFATAYVEEEVNSAGAMDTTVTDIIAPGTTNSATFAFAYTNYQDNKITAPEVAYTFDIDTTGSTCAADIQNNTNIQWKLDNGEWGTWTELMTAIELLDGADEGATTYGPGSLPAAFEPETVHTISWQWIFETADDVDTEDVNEMAVQDAKDTAMGNKTVLDQVKIVIKITATQVDSYNAG